MKFKQLPKDKRNNLILAMLLTAVALGGLGFGLIRFQYDHLNSIVSNTADARKKLKQMQDGITRADQLETDLAERSKHLAELEEGMAPSPPYSWVYNTIRRFNLAYKGVEIPVVNQPVEGETTLLPKFPYKQASLELSGTGFYHDIGKFIADFENQYPHIRVVNLTLDPLTGLATGEKEKLEFKMHIVALVRPNPS